jgi:hypothetical protein
MYMYRHSQCSEDLEDLIALFVQYSSSKSNEIILDLWLHSQEDLSSSN